MAGLHEVNAHRACLAKQFIRGNGVEVGAGDRPWPIPDTATCFYGDVRDKGGLGDYFRNSNVEFDGFLNAQTFEGVPDDGFDFVLSGHVIEHLPNPIGAIRETMRVLKPGGIFLLAVPDMRHTHDHARPVTTLEHFLRDEQDGGASTRLQAYEEHVRYVHPLQYPAFSEEQISGEVQKISDAGMDIHFHTWTGPTFRGMLDAISDRIGFTIAAEVAVQNENIYALRKVR